MGKRQNRDVVTTIEIVFVHDAARTPHALTSEQNTSKVKQRNGTSRNRIKGLHVGDVVFRLEISAFWSALGLGFTKR